ncbi:unnamed protein product [Adineta steineri]|uniref:Uncharacterized protein n=1 Tax=Adineta steineri TaxID=433720 RepID=A0A816AIG3_9BILA|nr:unnamed protein product [Adineta steineri]CAF1356033.1 unnamed protein product [Adineta steineri]CAF1422244.1 unnamed protein product [Adineta steineri]CAF1598558.1 unnamed protein product [Adineta steineri]
MFILIYFVFITLTYAHNCSLDTSIKYNHVYLCREKLNSTSLRIWLHLRFNQSDYNENFFSYYIFTLRVINLISGDHIHLEDRFEKQIGDFTQINRNKKENNTINIHHLSPGRYEICVNLLSNKTKKLYYRSSYSCIHIPWHVPEFERYKPNPLKEVLLIISFIILLITIAFVAHNIHTLSESRKPLIVVHNIDEEEDNDNSELAKLLANKHFVRNISPLELLVRKRIHERYKHQSPDVNEF